MPWSLTAVERALVRAAGDGPQGVDVVIHGKLDEARLHAAIARLLTVWPELSSRVEWGRWVDPQPPSAILRHARNASEFPAFRRSMVDPRQDPPMRLLWLPTHDAHRLSLAIHPAAADEQALFHVFVSLLLALVGEVPLAPRVRPIELVKAGRLLAGLRIGEVTRLMSQVAQFARRDAVFQLRRGTLPSATYTRWINTDVVVDKANRLGTSPLALVATAWALALAEMRQDDPRRLMVAVPISMRNEVPEAASALGNLVWPVYVPVERRVPLRDATRAFAANLRAQTQARVHYARPIADLGRGRFWRVARRFPQVDVPSDFGTTRVSWTGHPAPLTERLSAAGLQLVDQQIFSPVPPRVGATLTVVSWPYGTQLLVNYRPDSLDEGQVTAAVTAVQRQIEA